MGLVRLAGDRVGVPDVGRLVGWIRRGQQGGALVQRKAPGGGLAQGRNDRHRVRCAGSGLAYQRHDGKATGVTLPFDYTVLIGPLVIVWYIIGELGSLAEHAVNMGAKVPAWLPKILAAGKSAVDAAGDKIAGDDPKDEND